MTIFKNITIIIVTYKSSHIIEKTIKNINKKFNILISENSNDIIFKNYIEKKYLNCKVMLTGKNFGVSYAVNQCFQEVKTKYAFFITPDAYPFKNCIKKIYVEMQKNSKIAIMSARDINSKIKNLYGYIPEFNNKVYIKHKNLIFADWVIGGALFFNMKNLDKIGFFDTNFFLDYEEIDICVRARKINFHVVLHKKALTKNLKKASVKTKKIELLKFQRSWHYGWSIFYFYKKHFGYFASLKKTNHILITSCLKLLYHLFFFNFKKIFNHIFLIRGYLNSIIGSKSTYRSNL